MTYINAHCREARYLHTIYYGTDCQWHHPCGAIPISVPLKNALCCALIPLINLPIYGPYQGYYNGINPYIQNAYLDQASMNRNKLACGYS